MAREDLVQKFIGELAASKGISPGEFLEREAENPYIEAAVEARAALPALL